MEVERELSIASLRSQIQNLNKEDLCAMCEMLYGLYLSASQEALSGQIASQSSQTPIKELRLSTRTYNGLYRNGIDTVEKLLSKSESDLRQIRNLGEKSLEEIIGKLREVACDAIS